MATRDDYVYTADNGDRHPISLTDATKTVGGFSAGNTTKEIPAKVSLGNDEIGLRPRFWRLKRTTGSGANKKSFYHKLPVATKANWQTKKIGDTISYAGQSWKLTELIPENFR